MEKIISGLAKNQLLFVVIILDIENYLSLNMLTLALFYFSLKSLSHYRKYYRKGRNQKSIVLYPLFIIEMTPAWSLPKVLPYV